MSSDELAAQAIKGKRNQHLCAAVFQVQNCFSFFFFFFFFLFSLFPNKALSLSLSLSAFSFCCCLPGPEFFFAIRIAFMSVLWHGLPCCARTHTHTHTHTLTHTHV